MRKWIILLLTLVFLINLQVTFADSITKEDCSSTEGGTASVTFSNFIPAGCSLTSASLTIKEGGDTNSGCGSGECIDYSVDGNDKATCSSDQDWGCPIADWSSCWSGDVTSEASDNSLTVEGTGRYETDYVGVKATLTYSYVCDECDSDADCDDGNPCTNDTCTNPTADDSTCSNTNLADGTSCGTGKYCCGGVCNSEPSCPGACEYTGTCCSGTTAVCCNYGSSHQCDSTWKCTSGSGDNNYPGSGGDYKCQGYCDGSGNCDYASNCTDCGSDTCSDSGDSWTTQESVTDYESCSGGSCLADNTYWDYCASGNVVHDRQCSGNDLGSDSTKDCDNYDTSNCWLYCAGDGDINRKCDDWDCSSGACQDSGSDWVRNDPYYDCSDTASDSDNGDKPKTNGTCTNYELCSSGDTSCPSTDYPDNCASNTHLVEYYPQSNDCSSKDYYCSDFEDNATDEDCGGVCTSSDGIDSSTTNKCTGGTAAGCSGDEFNTDSKGDKTDYCAGSFQDATFKEAYPKDSTDACPWKDKCAYENINPDTNSNTCTQCGSDVDSRIKWNLGCSNEGNTGSSCSPDDGSYDYTDCCGDDSNEYSTDSDCKYDTCSSDDTDACCAGEYDCVWNGGCYNGVDYGEDGYDSINLVDSDGYREGCVDGAWYAYPNITKVFTD